MAGIIVVRIDDSSYFIENSYTRTIEKKTQDLFILKLKTKTVIHSMYNVTIAGKFQAPN